ncbi:Hypothetical_protein [Hexamita inflata]|uniref:Hypothetical_protein n=1 Tax=Hexamita inflata TaxID=28002 RepID=A0AA86TXP3_9EUKA|nr:Hypothetical protein HINF_LOCUS20414 [Hexamita inflata]
MKKNFVIERFNNVRNIPVPQNVSPVFATKRELFFLKQSAKFIDNLKKETGKAQKFVTIDTIEEHGANIGVSKLQMQNLLDREDFTLDSDVAFVKRMLTLPHLRPLDVSNPQIFQIQPKKEFIAMKSPSHVHHMKNKPQSQPAPSKSARIKYQISKRVNLNVPEPNYINPQQTPIRPEETQYSFRRGKFHSPLKFKQVFITENDVQEAATQKNIIDLLTEDILKFSRSNYQ